MVVQTKSATQFVREMQKVIVAREFCETHRDISALSVNWIVIAASKKVVTLEIAAHVGASSHCHRQGHPNGETGTGGHDAQRAAEKLSKERARIPHQGSYIKP